MNVTKLRAEPGGARHGSVHVQPELLLTAYAADLRHRIDRIGGSSANRRANEAGHQAGFAILIDLTGKHVRSHGKVLVHCDHSKIFATQASDLHILLNRGMRLRRCVSHQFSIASALIADEVGSAFARRQESAKRSARCGVLNNASTGARRKKLLRQVEHLYQPVEHMSLEFSASWAGDPQHPLYA